MRYFTYFFLLLIFFGLITSLAGAQTEKRVPVIVELFTSEGCSTCPPADKFLQKLVAEQPVATAEIIILGEHVDYWNRPEWIDPFSSAQFSNRQKYYAVFFKNSEIHTPQMVIDGTQEFMIREGHQPITEAAKNPKGDVILEIENVQDRKLSLKVRISNLPEIAESDEAVVLVAVIENELSSNVSGGENAGKKLKHSAVTRVLKKIGGVTNVDRNLSADITLGTNWKRNDLSIVAFVQEASSRRILGAARIDLKNQVLKL